MDNLEAIVEGILPPKLFGYEEFKVTTEVSPKESFIAGVHHGYREAIKDCSKKFSDALLSGKLVVPMTVEEIQKIIDENMYAHYCMNEVTVIGSTKTAQLIHAAQTKRG